MLLFPIFYCSSRFVISTLSAFVKMAVKQVIEGRYIDRSMLVKLLERTFSPGDYEFRVSHLIHYIVDVLSDHVL